MTEFTTNKMTESSSFLSESGKSSSSFSTSSSSSRASKRIWLISIVSLVVVLGFGLAFFCLWILGPGSLQDSAMDTVEYRSLDNSPVNECTKPSTNKSVASCCLTDSCKRYTRLLRDTMDFSVDPCKDFHGYVCGNWHKHKPANKYRVKTSHMELQLGRVFKKIRLAIEELEEEDSVRNRNRSRIVQYAIDLQHECNDAQRREKLGIEPVGLLLQDVLGCDRWPLLEDSKKIPLDSHHQHQWMDTFVEAQMLGLNSLIRIVNAQEFWIIILQKPSIIRQECGSKISEDSLKKSFQNYKKIARNFLTNGSKNGAWNSSHDQILFEVVNFEFEFESTFCKMLMHNPVSYDPKKLVVSIKLADLKLNYSTNSFDWTLLLNKFGKRNGLKRHFSDEDLVQLSRDDLDKLKSVVKLICSTPIRVWKNFVGFKLLAKYPNLRLYLDKKNREMDSSSSPENSNHFLSGHKQSPLWNVCLQETAALLLPVYARMYIDYVGRGKMASARAQVIEMVQHLKESFGEALNSSEHSAWLDEPKRHFILDRLTTLRSFIAYPEWILQDELLDREYGFDLVDSKDSLWIVKGNYLASSFNLIRRMGAAKVRNPLSELRESFDSIYGQIAQYQ